MPTLRSATPAINAQTKKITSAHEPGTVMAEPALPARALDAATPRMGSAAIASKAKNQTAKRVLEFRRPTILRRIQAKRPMAMPSSMQLSMLSADIRASAFRFRAAIICLLVPVGLSLFQELAEAV